MEGFGVQAGCCLVTFFRLLVAGVRSIFKECGNCRVSARHPGACISLLAKDARNGAPRECHSTPAMIRIYGTNIWIRLEELGDTVGAQIVSVPMSVLLNIADRAFRTLMTYLCGMGLAALILLDLAMVFIENRPVSRLSALADEVSNGSFNVPEIW